MRAIRAQTIEVESLFQSAPLSGMWKHQVGDDPRWADPCVDDSAWPIVAMSAGAVRPGDGFSWFRFRVRLPRTCPSIAIRWLWQATPMKCSEMANASAQ